MSRSESIPLRLNLPVIRLLVMKDWQLFQKQLAAYVAGGVVALCFLGLASAWSFYVGSLLLLITMISVSCFAISNSLMVERKENTLPFVMSLPVSPLDFYLSKLIGNLATFGVPFVLLFLGTLGVVLFTPLPDGLVVYTALIFGHILVAYSVSLSVAMSVESEGWNTFTMIASMVMINPFIMLMARIPEIMEPIKTEAIVWSTPALAILAVQIGLTVLLLGTSAWVHCRKSAFY